MADGQNEPCVVMPAGNIIAAASRSLREKLQGMVDSGAAEIVLDLSQVELIDSIGIGMLIGIQNALKAKNGRLKITHCSEDIRKMLRLMRLDRHIDIAE